jgi:hypothetical protein
MPKTTRNNDRKFHISMALNIIQAVTIAALAFALLVVISSSSQQKPSASGNVPASNASVETLSNIGQPLNSSELSVINNAPDSYFEEAGQMLLNQSLTNYISVGKNPQYAPFIVNGKPSVIYVGAISCVYCGENRWAMALALSRFGSFTQLFKGYSSLGDHDVRTLYWNADNYNAIGASFGNFYQSKYINFISAEYDSPIDLSLQIQTPAWFASQATNVTYKDAMLFMNSTGKFGGTPFTFWGTSLVGGADASIFGNSIPSGNSLPISNWTHAQILSQLSSFNDQFAWSEYAAADVYAAQVCPALQDSNTIPVCGLPAIKTLEGLMNLTAANQSA